MEKKIQVQEETFDLRAEYDQLRSVSLKVGAVVTFTGTVRDLNEDESVQVLHLEHYPGMTEKYLENIVNTAIKKYKIIDGLVIHRVGLLEPTDPIVVVTSWSEHRENAFNATRDIMEALKAEAPFWKKESTDNGFRWVEPTVEEESKIDEV